MNEFSTFRDSFGSRCGGSCRNFRILSLFPAIAIGFHGAERAGDGNLWFPVFLESVPDMPHGGIVAQSVLFGIDFVVGI